MSGLSASVAEGRLGKAFAVHSFAGTAGFAIAPFAMATLMGTFGWRGALIVAGSVGIVIALALLLAQRILRDDANRKSKPGGQLRRTWQALIARRIVSHFIYFATSSAATGTLGAFTIVVLVAHYAVSERLAGRC